ncbi:hypothetical protein SANTM175S_09591 [Streptomyces antimycoticus]
MWARTGDRRPPEEAAGGRVDGFVRHRRAGTRGSRVRRDTRRASTRSPSAAWSSDGRYWSGTPTAARRPTPSRSPAWVHGDFHPMNLLYRDARNRPPSSTGHRLGVQPRAGEAVRAAAIYLRCGQRAPGKLTRCAPRRAYRCAAGEGVSSWPRPCTGCGGSGSMTSGCWRWRYQRGDRRAEPQFPAAVELVVWWTREYARSATPSAGDSRRLQGRRAPGPLRNAAVRGARRAGGVGGGLGRPVVGGLGGEHCRPGWSAPRWARWCPDG